MNKVVLVGRITKDVEVKQTQSGIPVASFNLAINSRSKDKEIVDFIPCIIWQDRATKLAPYLTKGKLISVAGALHSRKYDDSKGVTHYVVEVNVSELELLGKKENGGYEQPPLPEDPPYVDAEEVSDEVSDEGIPI